jgi:hypothetical protein
MAVPGSAQQIASKRLKHRKTASIRTLCCAAVCSKRSRMLNLCRHMAHDRIEFRSIQTSRVGREIALPVAV